VGSGSEATGLKNQAERLGVADSVHLLGRRDDVARLLAHFDVFAFPSHFEGLPGALLEAMAARCPIVCTPVDGNSELVSDDEHALYVPPQSPDALSDAVSKLLSDPGLAERLAVAAGERAENEFRLERMVSEFESFYKSIINPADTNGGFHSQNN
jgi:glycosyltransferase involved in cell wall biosynthesis